jgi:hypothetical protein
LPWLLHQKRRFLPKESGGDTFVEQRSENPRLERVALLASSLFHFFSFAKPFQMNWHSGRDRPRSLGHDVQYFPEYVAIRDVSNLKYFWHNFVGFPNGDDYAVVGTVTANHVFV